MVNIKKFLGFLLIVLGVLVLTGSDEALAKKKEWKNQFHGNISNRYRLRATGAESDHDLESLLTLNVGDASYQKVTAALQGGIISDLDNNQNSPLSNIYDSFDGAAVGRLYYGYVDVRKVDSLPTELVRVGRQHLYDFESFYFDGVSFDSKPFYGVRISGYAGVPVHLYESQFGWDNGDWLVGSALSWTPVKQVRVRFDYAHLKDDTAGFRTTQADQSDDLLGGTVWVDISKNLETYARFTGFSDQVRDLAVGAAFKLPKQDLRFNFRAFRLLNGYDVRVLELDAYSIAGTFQPYSELSASVTKGLGKHFMADAGFGWRLLDDTQTASAFNHGYKRGFLSLTSSDLPIKGFSLTATGDYYHGEDSTLRNDYFGGSFTASQHLFKKRLTLAAGTAYYLYRFNFATANESQDVQTYFGSIEGKIAKRLRVKSNYEFEHNDQNGFHTLRLGMAWEF